MDKVIAAAEDFPISLDEAKDLRLKLMDERRAFVQDVDSELTSMTFNFCEH